MRHICSQSVSCAHLSDGIKGNSAIQINRMNTIGSPILSNLQFSSYLHTMIILFWTDMNYEYQPPAHSDNILFLFDKRRPTQTKLIAI